MVAWACLGIFCIGYGAIAFEKIINIPKSMAAVALASMLWVVIGIAGVGDTHQMLKKLGEENFGLLMFLVAAMTLVEILVHYQFFDWIRMRLLSLGVGDWSQALILGIIGFFLSAVIDNMTDTIVMLQIALRFFAGHNLLVVAAMIPVVANYGGGYSPLGDVPITMLWLEEKFTAWEVVKYGFLPAFTGFVVSMAMFLKKVSADTRDIEEETVILTLTEKVVIASTFCSFFLPFPAKMIGLEPFMGLWFGLGMTWCLIVLLGRVNGHSTHLDADIRQLLVKVDFDSIIFFAGILFAVGALRHVGLLESFATIVFGQNPGDGRYVFGNTVLGLGSAVVDNLPATAAVIQMMKTADPQIWVLCGLLLSTGGSILIIGSAAGVVAQGMMEKADVKEKLDFFTFMRIGSMPAAVGYVTVIAVWCIQRLVF